MKQSIQYTYIDLFSGAGGLSLGFDKAGFINMFALDKDSESCKTYRYNFPTHHLIETDISALTNSDIKNFVNHRQIDVIIGGPPCQGFSMAGRPGRLFIEDPRNKLFKEFARIVALLKPKIFVMENVARLYSHNNGATRKEILHTFQSLGYTVECQVCDMAQYGVPQHRNRIIFIGNLNCKQITFPAPSTSDFKTVQDAISSLPVLRAGENSDIPNHNAMHHSAQMLEKMSFVKEGGNRLDIPVQIRPLSGDSRKYIRYDRNKPSICITGDMRKVFHYEQNRALTVRELARLQSFPDDFVFLGNHISQQQQVGNAVPPKFAESLAYTIKDLLDASISGH